MPLLPSHEPLSYILRDLLQNEKLAPYGRFLAPSWEDAAWVGNRLAELLPLPLHVRQALLEMTEPALLEMTEPQQRLDILLAIFQEQRTA